MATINLAIQNGAGQPGEIAITFTDSLTAGDDYTFDNDGRTYLYAVKGNAASSVLTFTTTKTVSGLAVADPTRTVARNTTSRVGPFPVDLYGTVVAISSLTNEGSLGLAAVRGG